MVDAGELTDSPSPVMTFEAGGSRLAVRVFQVDRVAVASRLWPVPLARPEHVGLFDNGQELVPVLQLNTGAESPPCNGEQLVAILHVRGENVGLAIERVGRVHERYGLDDPRVTAPGELADAGAVAAISSDDRFWLVDADRLFAAADGATSKV